MPAELQLHTSRFCFGRRQFHAFLARIGANVLVRGHEVVAQGFRTVFDGRALLLNVFSAGGADNADLPVAAAYRHVVPAALTMRLTGGERGAITATPWTIDYAPYVTPARNAFYGQHP